MKNVSPAVTDSIFALAVTGNGNHAEAIRKILGVPPRTAMDMVNSTCTIARQDGEEVARRNLALWIEELPE